MEVVTIDAGSRTGDDARLTRSVRRSLVIGKREAGGVYLAEAKASGLDGGRPHDAGRAKPARQDCCLLAPFASGPRGS